MTHQDTSLDPTLLRILDARPTREDFYSLCNRAAAVTADFLSTFPGLPKLPVDHFQQTQTRMLRTFSKVLAAADVGSPMNLEDEALAISFVGLVNLTMLGKPEWVLPFGFDEVRFGAEPVEDPTIHESAKGLAEEALEELIESGFQQLAPFGVPKPRTAEEERLYGDLYRHVLEGMFLRTQFRSPTGTWHPFEGVLDRAVPPAVGDWREDTRSAGDWVQGLLDNWRHALEGASADASKLITLAPLARPLKAGQDTLLHQAARGVLAQLAAEGSSFEKLHWRQLEELVAELLKAQGMKVTVTPRSGDGGRDVLARGELIPGEPTLLAVEVKHKPVVGIGDLRQALWANRQFPALLFATSGRFSAGVIRERKEPDNHLRLYLKDGVGLNQWIDSWARRFQPGNGP